MPFGSTGHQTSSGTKCIAVEMLILCGTNVPDAGQLSRVALNRSDLAHLDTPLGASGTSRQSFCRKLKNPCVLAQMSSPFGAPRTPRPSPPQRTAPCAARAAGSRVPHYFAMHNRLGSNASLPSIPTQ